MRQEVNKSILEFIDLVYALTDDSNKERLIKYVFVPRDMLHVLYQHALDW
jgi:hypothetical protein